MGKGNTIESRVAQTVLQQPVSISVGRKTYQAAPPSVATLMLVSEAVSRIPGTPPSDDKEHLVENVLAIAKDCRPIAEMAAILILGAKAIKQAEKRDKWHLFGKHRPLDQLTEELMLERTPAELFQIISKLLATMQVGDFFGITTFLQGVNLLRPTKVVDQ